METTSMNTQMIASLSFVALLLLVAGSFLWASRRRTHRPRHSAVPAQYLDDDPKTPGHTTGTRRLHRPVVHEPHIALLPELERLVSRTPGLTARAYRNKLIKMEIGPVPSLKRVASALRLLCSNHHTVTSVKPKRRQNGGHVPERLRRRGTHFFPATTSS